MVGGAIFVWLAAACVAPNPAFRDGSGDGAPAADASDADRPDPGPPEHTGGAVGAGGSAGAGGATDAAGPEAGPIDGDSAAMPDATDVAEGGPDADGLVLHWRFDDPAGSAVATDSSGNQLNGAYQGDTHSPEHAPTTFSNVASRRFTSAAQAVILDSALARLRPTAITVSVWFRTSVTTRADLVTYNSDYFIRYMPPALEFVRRRPPNASGSQQFITATANTVSANDDRWHHVAGTANPQEAYLWLDGVRIAEDKVAIAFLYTAGVNRLVVGRAVDGLRAFPGWLDDLRIYDRVLLDDEIRALASRAP